jgi:hypothetical protein
MISGFPEIIFNLELISEIRKEGKIKPDSI